MILCRFPARVCFVTRSDNLYFRASVPVRPPPASPTASPQPPETSNGTQKMSSRVIIQSSPIAIPVPSQLFGTRPPAEGASAAKMPPFAYSPMEIGKACGGGGGGGGKTPSSKQKWEQAEDETIEDNYLTMAQIESDSDAEEDDMGTIAGYCVEELIGTGAFARVFVGRHPATWNKVAIKQVKKPSSVLSRPSFSFAKNYVVFFFFFFLNFYQ